MLYFEETGTYLPQPQIRALPELQAASANHPSTDASTLPIHVISLRRSVARRQCIARQLTSQGISFSFLEAVDGSALQNSLRSWVSPLSRLVKGCAFTPGQVGCWLSHRLAWEAAARAPDGVALILEDDAVIGGGFLAELHAIEKATRTFEVVQLSFTCVPGRKFHPIADGSGHRVIGRIFGKANGGGAYLVRSAGARKLLSIGSMAFCNDDWAWYEALTGLTRCGVWPPLVTNPPHDSVIAEVDSERGVSRRNRKQSPFWRFHKLAVVPALGALQRAIIAVRTVRATGHAASLERPA